MYIIISILIVTAIGCIMPIEDINLLLKETRTRLSMYYNDNWLIEFLYRLWLVYALIIRNIIKGVKTIFITLLK